MAGSWIRHRLNSSSFYLDALNAVARFAVGTSTNVPLLQNSLTPKIDYARYERARHELQGLQTKREPGRSGGAVLFDRPAPLVEATRDRQDTHPRSLGAPSGEGWAPRVCHCLHPSRHSQCAEQNPSGGCLDPLSAKSARDGMRAILTSRTTRGSINLISAKTAVGM